MKKVLYEELLMRGKTLRVTMARGSDKPHAD